jgi:D-alanyl-D-alanine carboxypeptidase/D-alanyl-D-alanine-endopeptidase (penicillin-binding protein 4)
MRLRRPRLPVLALCLLCFSAAARAADPQAQFQAAVAAAHLGHTRYGLYAMDLTTRRELVSINADDTFMPASNLKVVTTAAALATLGPDFMFHTDLRLLDNPDPAAGAVLVVHGDGDPAFGDSKLLAQSKLDVEKLLDLWVRAAQKAGVTKAARLVLDDRIFDYTMTHPSWPAAQFNSWYCAQVSGLDFCDNCFDIYASGSAAGAPAHIDIVPAAPFLAPANRTVTGGSGGFLVGRKTGTNELQISGGVAAHSKASEPVCITMHDPAMVLGQVLADRLTRAGVPVAAISRATDATPLSAGRVISRIQTPLPVVLGRCLKDSQNLFAESLFKRTGAAVAGAPGSWDNGAKAVTAFLYHQAGVQEGSVTIVDGSGLSRGNRVTPRCFVQVLAAMHRDPRLADIYRDSLSVAGQDGTLARRLHDLHGQVYGKSGYIVGVSSLSGYLVLPAPAGATPRTIAFSLLFNDVGGELGTVKSLEDHLVRLLDADFSPAAVP